MKKNAHWYTNGIVDHQIAEGESIPEGFYRGRTKCGKGTAGYVGINNGKIETYLRPGEEIPEGFKLGWLQQTIEHKNKISKKLKEYKKTAEHCKAISESHKTNSYFEKIKATCEKKYGVSNPFQAEVCKQKIRETNLKRYGVEYISQNPEIRKKQCYKYNYNGEIFDSSWELAVWIYAKDHNEDIAHEPEILEYEFEGKTYKYFPDFKYRGKLIEVKGDHFFNEDGEMINPFTEEQTGKAEAKHQRVLENNVIFYKTAEIMSFLEYINNTYGKDYLASFKKID